MSGERDVKRKLFTTKTKFSCGVNHTRHGRHAYSFFDRKISWGICLAQLDHTIMAGQTCENDRAQTNYDDEIIISGVSNIRDVSLISEQSFLERMYIKLQLFMKMFKHKERPKIRQLRKLRRLINGVSKWKSYLMHLQIFYVFSI